MDKKELKKLKDEKKQKENKYKTELEKAKENYLKKFSGVKGANARWKRSDEYKAISKRSEKAITNTKVKIQEVIMPPNWKEIYSGGLVGLLRGGANSIYNKLLSVIVKGKDVFFQMTEITNERTTNIERGKSVKEIMRILTNLSKRAFDSDSYFVFLAEAISEYKETKKSVFITLDINIDSEQ